MDKTGAANVALAQGKETTEAELIAFCEFKLSPVKTPIKINFFARPTKGALWESTEAKAGSTNGKPYKSIDKVTFYLPWLSHKF